MKRKMKNWNENWSWIALFFHHWFCYMDPLLPFHGTLVATGSFLASIQSCSPLNMWSLDIQRVVAYIWACQLLSSSLSHCRSMSLRLTGSGSIGLTVWSTGPDSNWFWIFSFISLLVISISVKSVYWTWSGPGHTLTENSDRNRTVIIAKTVYNSSRKI